MKKPLWTTAKNDSFSRLPETWIFIVAEKMYFVANAKSVKQAFLTVVQLHKIK